MANVQLISGTVMGTAEFTAEEIEQTLLDDGHAVTRHTKVDAKTFADNFPEFLVVCTSTTGAGELPSELHDFHAWLTTDFPKMSDTKYLVVALGDSSYVDFCGGGELINAALQEVGAQPITEMLRIDGGETFEPELVASPWVSEHLAAYL